MTSIVTCAQTRSALAAVRALGRHKIPVAVGSSHRPALAQWSALATSTFLMPDPHVRPEAFAYELGQQVIGRRASSVWVSTDAALYAMSRWREHLPSHIVSHLPAAEAVCCAVDRYLLTQKAQELQIQCVPTQKIRADMNIEEVVNMAKQVGFPLVLIPQSHLADISDPDVPRAFHFKSAAELRKFLGTSKDTVTEAALQPMLSGISLGYGAVYSHGEPVAEVFQRRGREHEPASQFSCYSETISPHAVVQEQARRLLKSLSWHGPVKLEFIQTYDGELVLACMLGRLWGSLQLAIHAGVDVPMIWHHVIAQPQTSYAPILGRGDVRMRWLMGEMSHLVDTLTFQWVKQRGTKGWQKSIENVAKFLNPKELKYFGTDVLRMSDPLPFVYEMQKTVRKVIKQKADRLIDEATFVRPLNLPTNLERPLGK